MLDITNADAAANILRFAEEGRLTQSQWHGRGADGRDIACLLGAIHPSVTSAQECNGKLMPMWLAEYVPVGFDGLPASEIVPMARKFAACMLIWGRMPDGGWERVKTGFLIEIINVALEVARPVAEGKPYWPAVDAACSQVKAALRSGVRPAAWAAARAAAWAAAKAAARAPAEAAAGAAAHLRLFTFLLDQIAAECEAAR